MATPSAARSRPRRRASVSTARRSLVPSTSTAPRSCMLASDQVDPIGGAGCCGNPTAPRAPSLGELATTGPDHRYRPLHGLGMAGKASAMPIVGVDLLWRVEVELLGWPSWATFARRRLRHTLEADAEVVRVQNVTPL